MKCYSANFSFWIEEPIRDDYMRIVKIPPPQTEMYIPQAAQTEMYIPWWQDIYIYLHTELPNVLVTLPGGPEEVCTSFHCNKLVTACDFSKDRVTAH